MPATPLYYGVAYDIAVILAGFNMPMEMISQLFALLLFASAPLIARASSDGAHFLVIAAFDEFIYLVMVLILIVIVRILDGYLNLRSWPVLFFELLGSL